MILQVRDTTDAEILVGEDITLTCDIQLSEVLFNGVNVTVEVKWYRNGSKLSDSTRISIATTAGPSEVQSRLSFRPVISSDSGRYRCTAILTPLQGTSSSVLIYQDRQLTVQSMLVVYIDPHTINTVQYTIMTVMLTHACHSSQTGGSDISIISSCSGCGSLQPVHCDLHC